MKKRQKEIPGQFSLFNSGYGGRYYKGQQFSLEHRRKIAIACSKPYKFRSPDGTIFEGIGIKEFALSQNLSPDMMRLVASGNCYNHRGWSLPDRKPDPRLKPFRLLSPDNEIVEGHGVRTFAIALGLSPGHLSNVVNGIRPQCKGWRLATPENLSALKELTPLQTIEAETTPPISERFPIDKINQIRVLRAEGYSYSQICRIANVCHSSAIKYGKNIVKGQLSQDGYSNPSDNRSCFD